MWDVLDLLDELWIWRYNFATPCVVILLKQVLAIDFRSASGQNQTDSRARWLETETLDIFGFQSSNRCIIFWICALVCLRADLGSANDQITIKWEIHIREIVFIRWEKPIEIFPDGLDMFEAFHMALKQVILHQCFASKPFICADVMYLLTQFIHLFTKTELGLVRQYLSQGKKRTILWFCT